MYMLCTATSVVIPIALHQAAGGRRYYSLDKVPSWTGMTLPTVGPRRTQACVRNPQQRLGPRGTLVLGASCNPTPRRAKQIAVMRSWLIAFLKCTRAPQSVAPQLKLTSGRARPCSSQGMLLRTASEASSRSINK